MTEVEAKAAAIEYVQMHAQTSCDPVIDNFVEDIVKRHRQAKFWAANTAYVAGDVIEPVTANGRRYVVVVGGTSGATEPVWPVYYYDHAPVMRIGYGWGDLVSGTATLRDAGASQGLYNLRGAVHECWELKASRVAHLVTVTQGNVASSLSHLIQHFHEQAARWRQVDIA